MDASGEIYEGEFGGHRRMLSPAYGPKYGQARIIRGTREGVGTQFCPNGDLYEGGFVDSQRQGKGVCIYACGDIYDGEWKDGGRSGKGKMVAKNGTVYDGQWEVSEGAEEGRHGRGTAHEVDMVQVVPREVRFHQAVRTDAAHPHPVPGQGQARLRA